MYSASLVPMLTIHLEFPASVYEREHISVHWGILPKVQQQHDIELLIKILQFELKACAKDHTVYRGGKHIQLGEWLELNVN